MPKSSRSLFVEFISSKSAKCFLVAPVDAEVVVRRAPCDHLREGLRIMVDRLSGGDGSGAVDNLYLQAGVRRLLDFV